jgi:hypothetical protein
METFEGALIKMPVQLAETVQYTLQVGENAIDLNALVGQTIEMEYLGEIHCVSCGRHTKKSFSQGHCFPCFRSLASCDSCIIKPELCHYAEGTCRQPEWGEQHCLKPHVVYLSNTSGIKVGVTRQQQIPTRWIDQGAVQAMPLYEIDQRLHAGQLEDFLKAHIADKTNWRAMLKGNPDLVDLKEVAKKLHAEVEKDFTPDFMKKFCDDAKVVEINYPVMHFPEKVSSQSFDKKTLVKGQLMGVKGQYLILDTGVINIRKFAGYLIKLTINT